MSAPAVAAPRPRRTAWIAAALLVVLALCAWRIEFNPAQLLGESGRAQFAQWWEDFRRPDFNFRQFRSNAVLRWEYLPGSALFLVWSQGRDDFIESGAFDWGGDVRDLFGVAPDNVFMIKVNKWFSL